MSATPTQRPDQRPPDQSPDSAPFRFSSAVREEIAFKCALQGAAGSGKTAGALLLARGLVGDWRRVMVVDTENRSALQYAGVRFGPTMIPSGPGSFLHMPLEPPYDTGRVAELLAYVDSLPDPSHPSGRLVDALVFDSFSAVWDGAGGVLECVDRLGGSPGGWKVMTPRLRRLIDAVRLSRLHVFCTLRTKTEYVIHSEDVGGKQKVRGMEKVGTKPIMREGVDYEFTTVFRIDDQHMAGVDKDRTNLFADRPPAVLTEDAGRVVAEWAAGAACQIGSAEWVRLRLDDLRSYSGTIDGLATLWQAVGGNRARLRPDDFAALRAAKDASKDRLGGAPQPPQPPQPAPGVYAAPLPSPHPGAAIPLLSVPTQPGGAR